MGALLTQQRDAGASLIKTLSRVGKPVKWLPRHGTSWHAVAAENPVRNLVKNKQSHFSWKEPLGALAPIAKLIPAAALLPRIVSAIMRVADRERIK
jgi:hypothetical protein